MKVPKRNHMIDWGNTGMQFGTSNFYVMEFREETLAKHFIIENLNKG